MHIPQNISVSIGDGFEFIDRLIGERHRHPRSALSLTTTQRAARDQVWKKMLEGRYEFSAVPCPACGEKRFAVASLWDYHDLWYPVSSCDACGILHANPRLRARDYTDFYRHHYRGLYSSSAEATDEFINEQISRGRALVHRIEQLRGPLEGSRVYEVGCGAGGILRAFAEAGCAVAGADFDTAYLNAARRLEVDVAEGGTDTLEGRPPADLIILSHVLEHFWDIPRDLERVRAALTAKGMVYVEVPGLFSLREWRNGDFGMLAQTAHTLHLSLASLTRLMGRHGFELITGDEYIRSLFGRDASVLADVQDAHLRLLEESVQDHHAVGDASFRQAYLRCRWENLGLRFGPGSRVALYGAGRHTHYLLDTIRNAPGPTVSVILDDSPAKQGTTIDGIPVSGELSVDDSPAAIVISSDNYETSLCALAERAYGSRLPIVRLYDGLPPGPYPP